MQKANGKGDYGRDAAPTILSLDECDDPQLKQRIGHIKAFFCKKFKADPAFFVRVPGRVNLIGEHIDYCGYAVCPMALQQHILLAVDTLEEPILRLANIDEKYNDFETSMDSLKFEVQGAPQWYQYFMCGVRGVVEGIDPPQKLTGLRVVVSGNVPPSSGLSSSSALVCSAALATARVFKAEFTKRELASLSAKSERFIGTEGGGMDQAIAFLGNKGCAKLIEFNPLRDTSMKLPQDAVFVISHSLAEMNKAATGDFNCRVVECRLACQIIAKLSGLKWQKLTKLADLQKELNLSLEEMVKLVKEHLHTEPYSKLEAYFCNENCRSQAWKKFHEKECAVVTKFLSVTTNEDNGEDILLAIRVVCTAGLDQLKSFLNGGPPADATGMLGFTNGKYFPNFNAIFHLVTNIEQVSMDYLHTGCRIALHLTRCFDVSEDFAPLFLRIILGLDSNTHSLREMLRKSDEGLKFNVIGCAIYPSAALCNHSCDPNMFRATHGNYTVHRARRLIKKGEILSECYKSLFIHAPLKERRSYCKYFYYFECGCEACVKNWPLLEDLPENPIFGKGETVMWTEFKQLLKEVEALPDTDMVTKKELGSYVQLLNFLVTHEKRMCRLSFHLEKKICTILETTEEELNHLTLSENTKNIQQFQLHQRALHVYQEAWRVGEFFKAGEEGASLETLGALMTASHDSLRDLYNCSHPDLDKLCTIGKEYRYGARLTGAGWGGCSVALTSPENAPKFIEALKKEFYSGHSKAEGRNEETLVFLTEPQEGAMILV